VSEKGRITEMPEAAGVVCHVIQVARDVVVTGHVSVGTLVQGVEAQKVGTGAGGSGGALGSPCEGGAIVARNPEGLLLNGASLSQDVFVCQRAGQL
jgi:hypothetical protein